jgi:hypothetical protein
VIAPLEADDTLFHEVNLRTLRNTMLGNNLRLCGLAIPNGRDNRNLPTSILFSAPHGEDRPLLGFGLEIEGFEQNVRPVVELAKLGVPFLDVRVSGDAKWGGPGNEPHGSRR